MERTVDTEYGEVTLRNVMLEDDNGTDLYEGVDVKIDGEFIGSIHERVDFTELTPEEVEELLNENFEL